MARFKDRRQAARALVRELKKVILNAEAVVFGVFKGGVPLAQEISGLLDLPFEVIVSQKITLPHKPEISFGAISESGSLALNQPLVRHLGLSEQYLRFLAQKEKERIALLLKSLPLKRPLPPLRKKTAILTDDGLASGYTMLAAVREVKNLEPQKIIVATPCASLLAFRLIEKEVDKIVALEVSSKPLFAIAEYYEEWEELSEESIKKILNEKKSIA